MYQDIKGIPDQQMAWWFIVSDGQLLLVSGEFRIPHGCLEELPFPDLSHLTPINIGEYQQSPCYLVSLEQNTLDFGMGEFSSLRGVLGVAEELFMLAGRAWQMANFLNTHKFCGSCGGPMERIDWELATLCKSCNHRCYPRISPCIIVAIRKEKQILLARSGRHPEGMFSVLAGFVETGETLEQAVAREVMEEVGIKIKNLHYVTSQPWPFPHSLMMGYTAEYDSGEICIDDDEIVEADWYDFNSLPQVPPKVSIAGRLIELTAKLVR